MRWLGTPYLLSRNLGYFLTRNVFKPRLRITPRIILDTENRNMLNGSCITNIR